MRLFNSKQKNLQKIDKEYNSKMNNGDNSYHFQALGMSHGLHQ